MPKQKQNPSLTIFNGSAMYVVVVSGKLWNTSKNVSVRLNCKSEPQLPHVHVHLSLCSNLQKNFVVQICQFLSYTHIVHTAHLLIYSGFSVFTCILFRTSTHTYICCLCWWIAYCPIACVHTHTHVHEHCTSVYILLTLV